MDLEAIKELMEAMSEKGFSRISLKKKDGSTLELEKASSEHVEHEPPTQKFRQKSPPPLHALKRGQEEELKLSAKSQDDSHTIESPMVGTFYSSSSPGEPPFVRVGDTVSEESVVCIIEAMKVMNEVKAGKQGEIVEICVDNMHPVEFGTPLFKVKT